MNAQLFRSRNLGAAFEPGEAPPARFMFAPAGVHTIVASHESGSPVEMTVNVDMVGAGQVRAAFQSMLASNPKRRPYADFDHDRKQASMWPEDFEWDGGIEPGIYVRGEWSDAGIAAVKGKVYRAWSPTIGTDAEFERAVAGKDGVMRFPEGARGSRTNPAAIVAVGFDVGTLTNEPAFRKISPVRAKEAQQNQNGGTTAATRKDTRSMKVKLIRARGGNAAGTLIELDGDALIQALDAGDAVPSATAEMIRAREESAEAAKNQNKELRDKLIAGAIVRARERGAIPMKDADHALIVRAKKISVADLDAAVEYLDGLPAADKPKGESVRAAEGRQTTSVEVVDSSLGERLQGFVRAKQPISDLVRAGRMTEAGELSKQAGLVYCNELRPLFGKTEFLVKDLVRAATTTDANVGYLAGDLVLQETLEFLQNFLPMLSHCTTSFKAEAIEYGQTVIAHYLGVPDVLSYSQTTGWGTSAAANAASTPSATGVPVAINNYKGVEIRFTATQIGGTVRNLFQEQVQPSSYALAQKVVQDVIALITTANFTGTPLTKALNDFGAPYFPTIRETFDGMGVARMPGNRCALLSTAYENKLLEDTNFMAAVTMRNAYKGAGPDTLVTGDLPDIVGIHPIGTQEMTAGAENRAGFIFGKSALAVASRLMSDWTSIFPDVPATAAVTVATHPSTGLSMMLVRYTNNQMETANQRLALAYGVAKGQAAAGRLLLSQAP